MTECVQRLKKKELKKPNVGLSRNPCKNDFHLFNPQDDPTLKVVLIVEIFAQLLGFK